EKIADIKHDLGVNRHGLAGVGDHQSDFGNNDRHHQNHHGHKGGNDESRIDQGVLGFGSDLVGPVEIVGQIVEHIVELAGFFAGSDHVDVKRRKSVGKFR